MNKPKRSQPGKPAAQDHQRTDEDLLARLRDHLALLKEYAERARAGDHKFTGEVAAKLRLLVCQLRKPSTPLMLEVQRRFRYEPTVDGDSWSDWLQRQTISFQYETLAALIEWGYFRHEDFIRCVAEQYGAAHEDLNMDARLHVLRRLDPELVTIKMCGLADLVLKVGDDVVRLAEMQLPRPVPA